MVQEPSEPREAILAAASRTLRADPTATVARIADAAGVSRATFYRYFGSRAELLDALDIEPDPGARGRILAAALEVIGRAGLRAMSMDELAEAAGCSRASVYRLFPGKTALFAALLDAHSPFEEVGDTVRRLHDQPPERVLPEVLRRAALVAAPRVAILRSLILEVSAGTPEAVDAARGAIEPLLREVSGYLAAQAAAGRIRPMHPLLAGQALMGPLVFHLLTQSFAGPVGQLEIEPDAAAEAFAQVALRGLLA
jgi:AcrR family transcriptional regulator